MDTAQTDAALVAAQLASCRAPVAARGLQVAAATGATGLRSGDVLLAGGGSGALVAMRTPGDLEALAARREPLRLLVVPKVSGNAWGRAEIRKVTGADLASLRVGSRVSAGVHPLGAVQGPSAGLILALARLDALTPGDLTGGRSVAGTGAISPDGAVTTVGEVPEKVRAAIAAHVEVFFVPAWQKTEAATTARGTRLRVVPVRSVQEAVAWLLANGARAPSGGNHCELVG
jgi:PDZ domain-containing protein